jgi:hypothetical protein
MILGLAGKLVGVKRGEAQCPLPDSPPCRVRETPSRVVPAVIAVASPRIIGGPRVSREAVERFRAALG